MGKCDFCDKEAVGYMAMQSAFYCEDHKKNAEDVEAMMWESATYIPVRSLRGVLAEEAGVDCFCDVSKGDDE